MLCSWREINFAWRNPEQFQNYSFFGGPFHYILYSRYQQEPCASVVGAESVCITVHQTQISAQKERERERKERRRRKSFSVGVEPWSRAELPAALHSPRPALSLSHQLSLSTTWSGWLSVRSYCCRRPSQPGRRTKNLGCHVTLIRTSPTKPEFGVFLLDRCFSKQDFLNIKILDIYDRNKAIQKGKRKRERQTANNLPTPPTFLPFSHRALITFAWRRDL